MILLPDEKEKPPAEELNEHGDGDGEGRSRDSGVSKLRWKGGRRFGKSRQNRISLDEDDGEHFLQLFPLRLLLVFSSIHSRIFSFMPPMHLFIPLFTPSSHARLSRLPKIPSLRLRLPLRSIPHQ